MNLSFIKVIIIIFSLLHYCKTENEFCSSEDKLCNNNKPQTNLKTKRYLLYDVNPGEGFNLRRDVYMRIAVFVSRLRKERTHENWILVLPPWGPLYHWKSRNIGSQIKIPWSKFFDLSSLSKYVPVIEFRDFLTENRHQIEEVYYLQHYAEGWTDGKWEERMDIRDCIENHYHVKQESGFYSGWFWGYNGVHAIKFNCLSVQGHASTLKPLIEKSTSKSIMIDRAEVILHDDYGDKHYWEVRRSMRFSTHLIKIGDEFRQKYLNSSDVTDGTLLLDDWRKTRPTKGSALGGPYVAVHLRRQDFVYSRTSEVPSIKNAAKQLQDKLEKFSLSVVFVATDAPREEFEELKLQMKNVSKVLKYVPPKELLEKYKDGGMAIIDQWICSHARYFIGTYESTFSFRIQEEREILGFHPDTTFNRLCGDKQKTCEQPSRWMIVYD